MALPNALCAMISTDLHAKIMAEKEQLELNTLAEYVERIFTEHFEGGQISMKAERTLAVQIPAELFERLKEYLAARNLKQKQFLIQLIENALVIPLSLPVPPYIATRLNLWEGQYAPTGFSTNRLKGIHILDHYVSMDEYNHNRDAR